MRPGLRARFAHLEKFRARPKRIMSCVVLSNPTLSPVSTVNEATLRSDCFGIRKSRRNASGYSIGDIQRTQLDRQGFGFAPKKAAGGARTRRFVEDIRHAAAATLWIRDGCRDAGRFAIREVQGHER